MGGEIEKSEEIIIKLFQSGTRTCSIKSNICKQIKERKISTIFFLINNIYIYKARVNMTNGA